MEFTITSGQILGVCALITSLWAVWKIIKEIKKPNEALREKVDLHGELLKNHDERMKEIESSDKMILQCLLVIINHDVTGNGIDRLKETRDSLQEYLVNK